MVFDVFNCVLGDGDVIFGVLFGVILGMEFVLYVWLDW